jgi:hypothetical protein
VKAIAQLGLIVALLPAVSVAEEPVDWEAVNLIRAEGLGRSRVMQTLQHLTDVIGPRLTGSPQMREANEWTRDQLAEWGLENATLERWGRFGLGWTFSRAAVHMTSPQQTPLSALPLAWTPGTEGAAKGTAMKARIRSVEDLDKLRGKVRGKVLFLAETRRREPREGPEFERFSPEELEEMTRYPVPGDRRAENYRERSIERLKLRKELNRFLVDEGVVATVERSSFPAGLVRVGGAGTREPGESAGVTRLSMAVEHYELVGRLLDLGREVELELDVTAQFHDEDLDGYNTIAEIPGSDLADEVVMIGAHLDSWHPATGSNDNGAGSAVAMEAVRILRSIGVRPRRTIRIALWSGEEQGLLGSRYYVAEHFASRPEPTDPEELALPLSLRSTTWPLTTTPEHERFSAYYNLDNGSGRIRGIYTQGNVAVGPIFERWLEPFHDLGADTVTHRDTGGTDHLPFDRVGLPGFQFIQDSLDYDTRTHHSNIDHFDHAVAKDLKQASVVMASFVYHTAMRDELLPREPMPQPPPEKHDDAPGGQATGGR